MIVPLALFAVAVVAAVLCLSKPNTRRFWVAWTVEALAVAGVIYLVVP